MPASQKSFAVSLQPRWGCDWVNGEHGAAARVRQSWVLPEQTQLQLTCRRSSWISFSLQREEVYSCSDWLPWPLQKYSGEAALFMELCVPHLRYFLLCIPVSVKVTPSWLC